MRRPRLTIIIPTKNECDTVGALLRDLAPLAPIGMQIVVADGGSTDGTADIARSLGAGVVETAPGRGQQLRAGAAVASGYLLGFLHADVRLDGAAITRLHALAMAWGDGEPDAHPVAFRLRIDAPGLAYRIIEVGANLRSRRLGLPYGDQGLIVSRTDYDAVGGYPPIPLMEDVSIVRALRRTLGARGRVRIMPEAVRVSARRWERDGAWRRSARNLRILARWYGGTSPEVLARDYERER